jgi:hypothetical protein
MVVVTTQIDVLAEEVRALDVEVRRDSGVLDDVVVVE